ncbi:MAG: hypothetical protein ACYSU8_06010 [Planctomycetota bacterium]|jgi:hypothetical protein
MPIPEKLKLIGSELKNHSPFTLIGAATGIVFMLAGHKWFSSQAETLFSVFHPLHVVLSAMVTAALFENHRKVKNFFVILIIGVVGSIGIATLSDCILPFFGESILGAAIPKHVDLHAHGNEPEAVEDVHEHTETCTHDDEPAQSEDAHEHTEGCEHAKLHLGFIEEWYLVFPAAIVGVLLAYFRPRTHLPHASHVLLSTWASSAHMLMNTHADMTATLLLGMFIVLFLAVWLPCCVSDIVFPLLFVGSGAEHQPHSCVFCRKKDTNDEK